MKSWQKILLIFCCMAGVAISFPVTLRSKLWSLDETRAAVHVNIEIDKAYMHSVSILAKSTYNDLLLTLSADAGNETRTLILYKELYTGNPIPPLLYSLFLRIQKETAQETLNAMESISVFIGNKLFYFSRAGIADFQGVEQGNYIVYELPGLEYKKSIMAALLKLPPFLNWYGDFNLAIKAISTFFINPQDYLITWCFLICLLVLCRSYIEIYNDSSD